MKEWNNRNLFASIVVLLLMFLMSCAPTPESEPGPEAVAETLELTTAKVSAQLPAAGNQAMITGHKDLQYVVDAEGSSGGIQVVDTLLAAQATCGVFVAEKAALELDVPLNGATATSVYNEETQNVQVYLDLPGANEDQVLELANHFKQRCPIYTTLSEAQSIEFAPEEQFDSAATDSSVVTATLFRFGGANVTASGNTFVMDSVPPLDGPNNELNPLDMMLGGLAACSSFTYQNEISDSDISVVVEGDFDPSGVRDLDGPNPRIRNIRISLQGDGVDASQMDTVAEKIEEQCDLYAILKGTVDIDVLAASEES
jgi:uncharacterized OsmC-like protein